MSINKSGNRPKYMFVKAFLGLLDSLISIFTLGYYFGSFEYKYAKKIIFKNTQLTNKER